MKIVRSPRHIQTLTADLRKRGKKIGFVPTMGYLHEGHLSLLRKARKENDVSVASIFVNPTQFGPKEDFKAYPRDLKRDSSLCAKEKVDYLFVPEAFAMYPKGFETYVEPGPLASVLCGASRPGHFRGVATVVAKLFNLVRPHSAYFGQKDFQQALIIQRLAKDLDFDLKVRILSTVREKDGLAMSSRNTYLDADARRKALCLIESLRWSKKKISEGERSAAWLKQGMMKILKKGLSRVDYVEIRNASNLSPVKILSGKIIITLAGFVETRADGNKKEVRLIDNFLLQAK